MSPWLRQRQMEICIQLVAGCLRRISMPTDHATQRERIMFAAQEMSWSVARVLLGSIAVLKLRIAIATLASPRARIAPLVVASQEQPTRR